ncbi:MAG: spermidine synthase [Myxococcota bacterium]
MAELYAVNGTASRVEVRVNRRGRALRINGTLASWYRPGCATTGPVWDALAAPLLLLPPARRRSVLILGLGGGSVARIARMLAPRAQIVGVELDESVVSAAREHFDLDEIGVHVVLDDAKRYLARTRRRFDAVIEDVFVGNARAIRKPDWLPAPGLARAARHVARDGILVSNTIDETGEVVSEMRRLYASTLGIDVEGYDNRIVVGGPSVISGRLMRAVVSADPTLAQIGRRLRFRRLSGRCSGTAPRSG